ncbi:MAG: nucleotidyltransferase domain-containing protein [Deltaproteobacteria bacterium]|nr:nucleotidyltransferase domain-containing protein [Deltaproteobacteria bacterium]MBW2014757.1 nucleotidyltransferase domain-containing protein [Deltaproteobacteria bacterium]MBW2090100.1 nucleotidyltransferase domain-containing protein [Deltaproteobacteria bacterium]
MSHTLSRSEKEKVIQIISSHFFQQYDEIFSVYIFGSFISKRHFSDIDIGIITDMDLNKTLDFELKLENRLEKLIKYPVDVRILNQAPISFSQNVFRAGRVIIDKNPNMRADFEGRILKQYFDFSPFQQRYLQEVTNAPV